MTFSQDIEVLASSLYHIIHDIIKLENRFASLLDSPPSQRCSGDPRLFLGSSRLIGRFVGITRFISQFFGWFLFYRMENTVGSRTTPPGTYFGLRVPYFSRSTSSLMESVVNPMRNWSKLSLLANSFGMPAIVACGIPE